LNDIPNMDEAPMEPEWLQERNDRPRDRASRPVVAPQATAAARPAAPVARPATASTSAPVDPIDPAEPPQPVRRRRRKWPFVLFGLLALLVALIVIPGLLALRTFNSIERIPVAEALTPVAENSPGRNLLLVGTDSRDGIAADEENAGLILGGGTSGERSDTIMVLRIADDGSSRMLSLPRDLWLPIDGGDPQRINTAIARGPAAVINTIQTELRVPISGYAEVDLAGFIDLVDAVGGVTITIPHPAFDRASGLDLPVAGEVELDSAQALAWVRSRRYTEIVNGSEVTDPTSDLGRVKRQQQFLRALFEKVSSERNPVELNEMMSSVASAVRIDDQTSMTDALELANRIRTGLPESVELPTRPTTVGSAAVLVLADGSEDVLTLFR
jgi:LCP family protein required for cell wall assembly